MLSPSAGRGRRLAQLAAARLMVIVGASKRGRAPEEVAKAALAGGARLLELRVKDRPRGEVYEIARRLVVLCREVGALLIVNDDADVALAAGADGVHVGQEDLPPEAARRVVGEDLIVGLSTHDPAEASRAVESAARGGVDNVGVGTVFPSALKPDLAARGLESLRATLAILGPLPAYAIGGIDAGNIASVVSCGVHGAAIGSAIADADDPAAATEDLVRAIGR